MPQYNFKHVGKFNSNVVLDPDNLIRPGGFVKGHFHITNSERVNCYGIIAFADADATVKFKMAGSLKRIQMNMFYENVDIWGNIWETFHAEKGHKYVCTPLPPGNHIFPFNFALPNNIPGTFTSPYGKISYEVGACLITSLNGCPLFCLTKLDAAHYMNLYSQPKFFLPAQLEIKENKLNFLFFKKKNDSEPKLKFLLELTKTGFILGEGLPFTLIVENPKQQVLRSISVTLKRKTICKAEGAEKTIEEIIATANCPTEENFKNEIKWRHKFNLPKTLTPSFDAISLGIPYYYFKIEMMKLFYLLKVCINLAEDGTPLKGEIPINIGTINEACDIENTIPDLNQDPMNSDSGPSSFENSSRRDLRRASSISSKMGQPLLPAYSQISFLFAGSMNSLRSVETLPPAYEDCMKK